MAKNYRNIKAWQLADKLVKEIYTDIRGFPDTELYGTTSQLRRAAVSVPCNVVEGSSRKNNKDYLRFLYIAKGSLSETEYLLSLSESLGFLKKDHYSHLDKLCQESAKTLYGLIQSVSQNI